MIYLAALLAVCWLCDRLVLVQRIADWRTECLAAEADLRARQRDRAPQPQWRPQPPPVDLAEWDTAVAGMDWYHPWGQPADIRSEVDDQGATIHRIATRARMGEALERACRRISTDELEALVS